MSRLRPELLEKMARLIDEHNRIEFLLTPYGFRSCGGEVFYGEDLQHLYYCGKMEDYQMFINNLYDIKKKYLKYKNERLGIY